MSKLLSTVACKKNPLTNSADTDQTASDEAVWSGFWRGCLIGVVPVCCCDKRFVNCSPDNQHLIWEQKKKSVLNFTCTDPESFLRGGPTWSFFVLFFVFFYEGREDPNTTLSEPSLAGQWTALKWCFSGVSMMAQHWMLAWQLCDFQGIGTSIA